MRLLLLLLLAASIDSHPPALSIMYSAGALDKLPGSRIVIVLKRPLAAIAEPIEKSPGLSHTGRVCVLNTDSTGFRSVCTHPAPPLCHSYNGGGIQSVTQGVATSFSHD